MRLRMNVFSSGAMLASAAIVLLGTASDASAKPGHSHRRAKNVVLFIGDGMGISTIAATRVYSVGVDGNLVMDQFPHAALSRTADADHITPDSASTMTSMITGTNANSGVLGFGAETEFGDFNADGDGARLSTALEQAKAQGLRVGVVSTARVTHATPAACYSHINNRDAESAIALQALPTDPTYNPALGSGLDLILGGGRQFFVPNTLTDEEGDTGSRADARDLRAEFQAAGYSYVWNAAGFAALGASDLPVLGLFERSHMEYEVDRPSDVGGEPSLSDLAVKAVNLLGSGDEGFFLMVEGGRIDHAHHAGNAFRALHDAEALDRAIGATLAAVDLRETLVLVTADHSHVFTMAGYPLKPLEELGYSVVSAPDAYLNSPYNHIFDVVYDVDNDGNVVASTDRDGAPYTVLGYQNGPGYRGAAVRVDPALDPFPGLSGLPGAGPNDSEFLQESAVPLAAETHGGEDVALFGAGPGSELVRGSNRNSHVYRVIARALGL